jgi:hypothetical protein
MMAIWRSRVRRLASCDDDLKHVGERKRLLTGATGANRRRYRSGERWARPPGWPPVAVSRRPLSQAHISIAIAGLGSIEGHLAAQGDDALTWFRER